MKYFLHIIYKTVNNITGDNMKKIGLTLIIMCISLLVGCTLGNTPTSRVEAMLTDYQMLDDNISITYTDLIGSNGINQDMKNDYEDAIRKQYRDMSYEVKEEVIDGDTATVTVEIEVMNYRDAIDKYDASDYEVSRYHELVIKELESTKEMVTYTVDFTLTKDDNDNWSVDTLTEEIKDKLLGIY